MGALLLTRLWTVTFHKIRVSFRLTWQLLAYQEGLCPIQYASATAWTPAEWYLLCPPFAQTYVPNSSLVVQPVSAHDKLFGLVDRPRSPRGWYSNRHTVGILGFSRPYPSTGIAPVQLVVWLVRLVMWLVAVLVWSAACWIGQLIVWLWMCCRIVW